MTLGDVAGFLSEPLRQLSGTYNRALSGAPKSPDQLKRAYRVPTGTSVNQLAFIMGGPTSGKKQKPMSPS